jgi:predicted nuclease of predicted toxin-antitoxin system
VIIWVDAQMSPSLAPWITQEFGIEAASARHLGLITAIDPEIFDAARKVGATVLTKDSDFVLLLERFGPPPSVLWVRCGNTSNDHLRKVLRDTLRNALALLGSGESLVEINDDWRGR